MLWVPADTAPRREPFLVVDDELVVRAISRYAEAVLTVDEPAAVAAPLAKFMIPDGDEHETGDLTRMVRLAATGTPSTDSLQMLTAHEPPARFSVRVTSCGPPLAAMVILAPRATSAEASRNGRAEPSERRRTPNERKRREAGGDQLRPAAGGQRSAGETDGQAARSPEPRTTEEALTDLARLLIVSGQRLARGRSDIEAGLGAIASLRNELEHSERELVELARRSGLSWAQIGAELNIIGPGPRAAGRRIRA